MGLLAKTGTAIATGVVKETVGSVSDLVQGIIATLKGDVTPEKKAELLMQAKNAETQIALAQAQINQEEAKSANMFVSGWRPAAGWVCVFGLSYQFVIFPFFTWGCNNFKWIAPPSLDMAVLVNLLFGMLGLGTLRTVEKYIGKSRD
jgi:hypothetical protein